MSIQTLDPVTALIVVDLQKGVVAHPLIHPVSTIVQNAAELAIAFRDNKAPGCTRYRSRHRPWPNGTTPQQGATLG